jgi:hypothetical protein
MSFVMSEVSFIVIEAIQYYILINKTNVRDIATSFSHFPTFKRNSRNVI